MRKLATCPASLRTPLTPSRIKRQTRGRSLRTSSRSSPSEKVAAKLGRVAATLGALQDVVQQNEVLLPVANKDHLVDAATMEERKQSMRTVGTLEADNQQAKHWVESRIAAEQLGRGLAKTCKDITSHIRTLTREVQKRAKKVVQKAEKDERERVRVKATNVAQKVCCFAHIDVGENHLPFPCGGGWVGGWGCETGGGHNGNCTCLQDARAESL